MSLQSDSNLGAVGTLLMAVTAAIGLFSLIINAFFPLDSFVSPLSLLSAPVTLVGGILFLISMHALANGYRHRAIFDNVLYAIITVIVGVFIVFLATFVFLLAEFSRIFTLVGFPISSPYPDALQFLSVVFIPAAVGGAAVGLVALLFLKRAFDALAEKSEIIMFRKAGMLFPISAVVSAVFMIAAACLFAAGWFPFTSVWYFGFFSLPGGAVQLVAWALATRGFFALKQKAKQTPPAAQQPSPQSTVQVKFCPNCGASNGLEGVYCTRCGRQL